MQSQHLTESAELILYGFDGFVQNLLTTANETAATEIRGTGNTIPPPRQD